MIDDLAASRAPPLEQTISPETEPTPTPLAPGRETPFHGEENGGTDEKELSKELSTVAKRFLIAEINRLVEENQQLKQYKEKYHDVDKRLAVPTLNFTNHGPHTSRPKPPRAYYGGTPL